MAFLSCWQVGFRRFCLTMKRCLSSFSQVCTIFFPSAKVVAMGFSHSTWLWAWAICWVWLACMPLGVQTDTMSMSSLLRSSVKSSYAFALVLLAVCSLCF